MNKEEFSGYLEDLKAALQEVDTLAKNLGSNKLAVYRAKLIVYADFLKFLESRFNE